MKAKRKIIATIITVTIVALATLSFTGCNGITEVNPVNNAEFIKEIETRVWNEDATRYDNYQINKLSDLNELTNGTKFSRYMEISLEIASNKFDGYEFFQVEFDIVADRDVNITLGLYYGSGHEINRRYSAPLSLKANEKVYQEWVLTKNFVVANGDKSPVIYIKFEGEPTSGTTAFKDWSQTKYAISNLKFYAMEP